MWRFAPAFAGRFALAKRYAKAKRLHKALLLLVSEEVIELPIVILEDIPLACKETNPNTAY